MLEPSYEAVNAYSPSHPLRAFLSFPLTSISRSVLVAARFRFARTAVFASYNRLEME